MRVKALLLGLLFQGMVLGCQTVGPTPSLLTLSGMSPSELEIGDELQISGQGFPEGKPARVAFRGDLYRAGEPVERDVEIVARTTSGSPRSLSVSMTEALRQSFTGPDERARHTTFRGDVEVSFTPKQAGSAPVVGVLSDVVLDVEPPLVSPTLQQQRDRAADEALAFLGIELQGAGLSDCCVVANVTGRAHGLGLKSGDRIVELDGVSTKSRWDLVPSSERRTSKLSFRSAADGPVVVRDIDVQGFRVAAPSELAIPVGLVGLALVALLLHSTRLAAPLLWLSRWTSLKLRERESPDAPRTWRARSQLVFRAAHFGLPSDPAYHLVSVLVLVALASAAMALCFRIELISRELDLLLWFLFQTVSVVWAAILISVGERRNVLRSGLVSAFGALLYQLPLLTLLVLVVLRAKSFSLFELVDAQGGSPLKWNAFRSPSGFLLTALAIGALVPALAASKSLRVQSPASVESSRRWGALALGLGTVLGHTLHLWSSALLLALVGFGGYQVLPGISAESGASLIVQLAGAAVLAVKTVALVMFASVLRHLAGAVTVKDSVRSALRIGPVLVLFAAGLAWAWSVASQRFALGWLEDVLACVLVVVTIAGSAHATTRAAQKSRLSRADLGPNPWI
ncbi:MAG: PDZ domain-containing protein [Polyangiaceae bacterium]